MVPSSLTSIPRPGIVFRPLEGRTEDLETVIAWRGGDLCHRRYCAPFWILSGYSGPLRGRFLTGRRSRSRHQG
jgi:hypothetical protein